MIETDLATLAGHSLFSELTYARSYGMLGSIGANRGDELIGWGAGVAAAIESGKATFEL